MIENTETITLLLVRHGRAESALGRPDSSRHLTEEGYAELRVCCEGLQSLSVCLDLVLTSPLMRALETADVLAKALGNGIHPLCENVLAPGATLDSLMQLLRNIDGGKTVAIVGHAPDLTDVASGLVVPYTRREILFPPGGMACIEFEGSIAAGTGQLKWTYTPAELIAKSREDVNQFK
ncbi:MAG: phosphohistidine phosphatase SixA [Deltaproteobacteria bacterium]|nr:phosphohistidine phosphatase SixA [Deltaproteobacteria bacterium]